MILTRTKPTRVVKSLVTSPAPAGNWLEPRLCGAAELAGLLATASAAGYDGVGMTVKNERRGVFYLVNFQRKATHEN